MGFNVATDMQIIDVSDPRNPVLFSTAGPLTDRVIGITIRGGHAYLANDDPGLTVVELWEE